MSKYFFSILLLVSFSISAQQTGGEQLQPADTTAAVVPTWVDKYGLRIGADLNTLSRSVYDDGFRGIEVVADYRLSKRFYAAAEAGNIKYTVDDYMVNFTANGSYIKVGFDYNAYDNWLNEENMVFVGMRYGFSSFNQNLNSYKIYQNSAIGTDGATPTSTPLPNYFDQVTVQTDRKYSGLSAHWIEFVGGAKVEIINNLFLGLNVHINVLVTQKKPQGFDNLYIPGFNRTYDGSFGAGFNYTLSYFIPLYKKQGQPAVKK